ncbi:MAG: hypothetical protein LBG58_14045 [Planctomycetaceae bacterium]|nr:hypothetical protein [Planctomycetaceae bacterium]
MNQIRLGNLCFRPVWKLIAGSKQGQVGEYADATAWRNIAYLLDYSRGNYSVDCWSSYCSSLFLTSAIGLYFSHFKIRFLFFEMITEYAYF